jgi:hypothetical protein
MDLRIAPSEHCRDRSGQTSAFARFREPLDFRLFQQCRPDCDIEPGAIIWNVPSDWRRGDAAETPGKPAQKSCGNSTKCVVEFHSRSAQFSHFSAALKKNRRQDERLFLW